MTGEHLEDVDTARGTRQIIAGQSRFNDVSVRAQKGGKTRRITYRRFSRAEGRVARDRRNGVLVSVTAPFASTLVRRMLVPRNAQTSFQSRDARYWSLVHARIPQTLTLRHSFY